ncbi:hypothetical protein MP228_005172 [Amoeboaphelidium protococcarum]|nr:hypothetical protein MP228_005172 [Amoeboaphelidium protococcarum]
MGSLGQRLQLLHTNLVGTHVMVKTVDGVQYEGVFSHLDSSGITLKCVHQSSKQQRVSLEDVKPEIKISLQKFQMMHATDIDLTFASGGILNDRQGFKTDTGISGGNNSNNNNRGGVQTQQDGKQRELVAWTPDNSSPLPQTPNSSNNNEKSRGKWDQFAANEKLFGVKTDFKEELYTTTLDKNSAEYKKREREAARIAREIERGQTSNIHLAEERGHKLSGEIDEEDLYGAVVRNKVPTSAIISSGINNKSRGEGKYIPPSLRSKQQSPQIGGKTDGKAQKAEQSIVTSESKVKPQQEPSEKVPEAEKQQQAEEKPSSPKKLSKQLSFNPNAAEFKFSGAASDFMPESDTSSFQAAQDQYGQTYNYYDAQPQHDYSQYDQYYQFDPSGQSLGYQQQFYGGYDQYQYDHYGQFGGDYPPPNQPYYGQYDGNFGGNYDPQYPSQYQYQDPYYQQQQQPGQYQNNKQR